jgi:4-amino-4-deoxy-L-arabinose transferase-like glycosyltransferase
MPLEPLRASLLRAAAASVVTVSVAVPFMGRYGWDRDELYFLSASRHPALGYVDFPPLIAWLIWVVRHLVGDSLVALRLISLACGIGATLLVVLIARELGGGASSQLIAGFFWATTPYILGSGSLVHPTWLDVLAWTAACYVTTRIAVRRELRLIPLLGVIVGVGLEAKYTIAFLGAALVVAFAVFDREVLRGSRPWIAAGIALLLIAPNLAWQARHGWPSVHFASSQNAKTAEDTPPPVYVAQQVLFLAGSIVLAVAGVAWLWRRRLRALAAIPVLLTLVFLAERGRAYYALPADSIAVAAGAVALAGRRKLLISAAVVQAALCVVVVPVVVAVLPVQTAVSTGYAKAGFQKDEIGWPDLARTVDTAWAALPASVRAHAIVVAGNYGEASALERYAHVPVVSGHLSWQYWRPKRLPQREVLLVGFDGPLGYICASSHVVARIDNRWHLDNEERERTVTRCRLHSTLGAEWRRFARDAL